MRLQVAVPPLGDAREDWTIVRALSEVLDLPLPYDSRADVRARLGDVAPHLTRVGEWDAPLWLNGQYFKVCCSAVGIGDLVFLSHTLCLPCQKVRLAKFRSFKQHRWLIRFKLLSGSGRRW